MLNKIEPLIPIKLRNFVNLKGIPSSKKLFKSGFIELNGAKVQISQNDTIETLAKKINAKKFTTKVEALLISTKSCSKLLLKSKNDVVNLNDLNGTLENIYKKNDLGTNKNSLIQVIRDSLYRKPTDITFNYNRKSTEQAAFKFDKVNEYSKFQLSKYATNNPANDEAHLTSVGKEMAKTSVIQHLLEVEAETIDIPLLIPTDKLKCAKSIILSAFHDLENITEFHSEVAKNILLNKFSTALRDNTHFTGENLKDSTIRPQLKTAIYDKLIQNRPSTSWFSFFTSGSPPFSLTFAKENEIANWIKNLTV